MTEATEEPNLHFFRKTPAGLMSRPPLHSALQSLESSFLLLSLERFPHALVTCASSLEGVLTAALGPHPTLQKLIDTARSQRPALAAFDAKALTEFRAARNGYVHRGFGPGDDDLAAALLLEAGYPFLRACLDEFFHFDFLDGLEANIGKQLRIAIEVYQKARDIPDLRLGYCFNAFGHLLQWEVKEALRAASEAEALDAGWEAKCDHCHEQRQGLQRIFGGVAWEFDCPVCAELAVCELDEERLEDGVVTLHRAACPSCGLVVRTSSPFLADALFRDQLDRERQRILSDFGIAAA